MLCLLGENEDLEGSVYVLINIEIFVSNNV